MKPEVIDNFLSQEEFVKLQTLMMGHNFPWYYNDIIDYKDQKDRFMFTYIVFSMNPTHSVLYEKLYPILDIIEPVALGRIRANLLTKTPKIVENSFHHDIADYDDENENTIFPEKLKQLTTSIFYVNTNNGYTEFEDGTKVESVANRLVSFPCNLKHRGTSCTDENTRIVINFNYFK